MINDELIRGKNERWSLDKQFILEDLLLQEAGLKPEEPWVRKAAILWHKTIEADYAHFKTDYLQVDDNQNVRVIKDQRKFPQITSF